MRDRLPVVSERRACRVLGQSRSTQRYAARTKPDESSLIGALHQIVRRHPRYGYRRAWALLRRGGWRINRKRVWRLWKREGFKVPQKRRKKRRMGSSANGIVRRRARHRNDVWAWDFIHDRDERGRPLKWLSVVDEYTRQCVVLEVRRTMKALDVVDLVSAAMARHGLPRHLRSDNGPEFIAKKLRGFLSAAEVGTLYVAPGSPWENGYAESFHGKLRDELLACEVFADLAEAKVLASAWRHEYNHERPHSALGYRTPAEYAAQQQNNRTSPGGPTVGASPLPSARQATVNLQPTLIPAGT